MSDIQPYRREEELSPAHDSTILTDLCQNGKATLIIAQGNNKIEFHGDMSCPVLREKFFCELGTMIINISLFKNELMDAEYKFRKMNFNDNRT